MWPALSSVFVEFASLLIFETAILSVNLQIPDGGTVSMQILRVFIAFCALLSRFKREEKGVEVMDILFLVLLFVVAVLYASVGHGGASGYLALMALFGMEQYTMKSTALTLNLFVSAVSFYTFYKNGYFKFNILLPFILGSIPMAFLGARVNVDARIYKVILGIFLFVAVVRFFFRPKEDFRQTKSPVIWLAVLTGGVIGFFSGMIGIGGGIILSPLLLLFHWANVKETAGISALFIFLNSSAGLLGLYFNSRFSPDPHILLWAAVGLAGGLFGGIMSSNKLSHINLKYLLAMVLLVAGFKLLIF